MTFDGILRARVLRVALTAATVLACVALAACGDSDSSESSSGGSTGGPAGGPITAADIKVAQDFVGGKSGKATGTPIRVGYIQTLSGPIPPQPGADVSDNAREFINEKLGGIEGHPIEFVPCDVGASDEKAQACGQKFHNDKTIKAIYNPGQPTGGLATLGALQGEPMMFCGFPTQAETVGTNVLCPNGGVFAASTTITYLQNYVKPKTVAQILPNDPIFAQLGSVGLKQMKAAGIDAKTGLIPQNSPDVTAALISSGAKTADAIYVTLVSGGQCIAVAKALKSLEISDDTPVISLPTCNDASVAKALGGEIPKWTFFDNAESVQLPNPTPEAQVYLDAVQTYGGGESGTWSTGNFGTVLWMAKVMNEVGAENLTTDALMAEAKKFTGPAFLQDPQIKFGEPPYINTGSLRGRFYTYEGGGKFSDATNGKWIDQPKE